MNQILDGAATLTAMVIRLESERDAAIARAERAEAELAQYRAELADRAYEPCVWRLDENANDYVTGCNGDWFDLVFGDLQYCPSCGHRVWIAPSDNESEG